MKLHRSGWFGLVLGAALLGACEDKTEVIIPPPPDPPLTITITPAAITLEVGETAQLVATVSGGPAGTARTATFASANTAVATVDASSGVVTAVSPGTTTITARATADNNVAAAAAVTVVEDPASVPPEISIKSVTTGNTNTPVNINNVFGQIDITANLEAPQGAQIAAVEWLVDQTVVCRQEFSGAASLDAPSTEEAQQAVELVCSVNTAAFDSETGAVTFPNGPHQISVRVIGPGGTVIAEAPPTQFSQLVFNNVNFIQAVIVSSRGTAIGSASPRTIAPVGSVWHSGDITFTLLAVIYNNPAGSTTNNLANATVALTTSGLGVSGVAGCTTTNNSATDPTIALVDGGAAVGVNTPECPSVTGARTVSAPASGKFDVVFSEANSLAAATPGVANLEEIFPGTGGIIINSVTQGGQGGPFCINPDPALNPIPFCGTGVGGGSPPNQAFFINPLRVDNYAPRLVVLDHFRNPNNYFGPNSYLVSHVAGGSACPGVPAATPWFGLRRPCVRSVDYGVGSQTTTGNTTYAAVTVAAGAVIPANEPADLAGNNTATSNDWRLRISLMDSGANTRVLFATTTNTIFATTAAAGSRLWGWDEIPPVQQATGAPANMSVNTQIANWTISFVDQATPPAGPSGFDANPVWVSLQRDAASLAAPTCHDPDPAFPAVVGVPPCPFIQDDGQLGNPGGGGGLDGYWTWRHFVVDAAANLTTEETRWTLNDFTAPSFTGGIVVPATIAGAQPVAFSSALTDNVDLGSLDAYVGYAGTYVQFAPKSILGELGPQALAGTSAGVMQTNFFIRRVEGNAAGRPDGAPVAATDMNYLVRDMAGHAIRYVVPGWGAVPYTAPNDGLCPAAPLADGASTQNCSARVAPIAVQVLAAVGGAFPAGSAFPTEFGFANAAHGLFTMQAPSNAIICNNDPRVQCAVNRPFTTTLTVTLTGPAATYQTPFVGLEFYYLNAEGLWEQIASSAAPTVTDNTVLDTRTYFYQGVWDARQWKVRPAGAAGTAFNVVAIGRSAAGDAWISTAGVVTVEGN